MIQLKHTKALQRGASCLLDAMLLVVLLLPGIVLTLYGCGPSRSEIAQQQHDYEMGVSAQAKDDKTNEDYATRAKRLDVASIATVAVIPLTSQEALDEYSSRLADLQFLISSTEKDFFIQSPRSHWRLHIDASLNRAREALAVGMITKAQAELGMQDYHGASKTLRQVLAAFASKAYVGLSRQAERTLQDVEKAARLAKAQGKL